MNRYRIPPSEKICKEIREMTERETEKGKEDLKEMNFCPPRCLGVETLGGIIQNP